MKKILIVVYCLFIASLVATAMFASQTFDGDVDNAYDKGMQYPIDVALIKELGWQFAKIEHPLQQGQVSQIEFAVSAKDGQAVRGAAVTMEVSRATKLTGMLHPEVKETEAGHYVATVTPPFYGLCLVAARINFQGKSVPYNYRIYVAKKEKK